MENMRESKTNGTFSNDQDDGRSVGTTEKVFYFSVGFLCFIVSLAGLLLCYKRLNSVLSIIGNVVSTLLGLATLFSLFGIVWNIKKRSTKATLVAVLVGLGMGFVLASAISLLWEDHNNIDLGPQPSETVQLESDSSAGERQLPAETPPSNEPLLTTEAPSSSEPQPSTETVPSSTTEEDAPATSSTPTEAPSHAEPIIITPNPNFSELADSHVISDFYSLISSSYAAEDIVAPLADQKDYWSSLLTEQLGYMVNTDTQMNGVLINGDKEFGDLTRKANDLADDIESNGRSLEKQQKLIELRESAYKLYSTYNLRKLLSDDYFSLAELYKTDSKLKESYHYYLKSIEYELLAIKLCRDKGDEFYVHLYRLANRLHAIGDLRSLGTDNQIEAYYLSACLFESIAKSNLSLELIGYRAISYYYAGMSNHKLMNLAWGNEDPNSSYYFLAAYNYYDASLNFKGDEKHKNDYLADLCDWAQEYIKKYGQADGMLNSSEYRQLHDEYAKRVLAVETEPPSNPD